MAKLFLGYKPGVGSVVKVMANPADNPLATPNTAYGKFRFNSETADIGQIPFMTEFQRDPGKYPFPTAIGHLVYFWPDGSNAGNCKAIIASASATRDRAESLQIWYFFWKRILGVSYPPLVEANALAGGRLATRQRVPNPDSAEGGRWFSTAQLITLDFTAAGGRLVDQVLNSVVSPVEGWYSTFVMRPNAPPQALAAWALPADSSPLPVPPARARTPGNPAARISDAMVRVARPGYNALTAVGAEAIISETQTPARIIKTGEIALAPFATRQVNAGVTLPSQVKLDAMVWEQGAGFGVFPLRPQFQQNFLLSSQVFSVTYARGASFVTVVNESAIAIRLRYVLYADDYQPRSSGSGGKVVVSGGGFTQLRRPGAAPSPAFNDILLDTRWSYLPIVKQAFLPRAAFAATPVAAGEYHTYGSLRASVSWANDGSWKPFIKYMVNFGPAPQTGIPYITAPAVIEREGTTPNQFNTPNSRQSSVCRFSDTAAHFYISPDQFDGRFNVLGPGRVRLWQDRNETFLSAPVGIRYYVFAVPSAL